MPADAQELLVSAAAEPRPYIMRVRSKDGLHIQTGQRDFVEERGPRAEARWSAALDELINEGLVEGGPEIFDVTHAGFQATDAIAAKRRSPQGGVEEKPRPPEPSEGAQELLLEAEAHDGEFVWSPESGPSEAVWVRGGRTFSNEHDPAVAAKYIEAFQELQRFGLVRYRSGVVYCLTGSGYAKARELRARQRIVDRPKEKWVDIEYPVAAGIVKAEETARYRVSWCKEEELARKVELEGCETVKRTEPDGSEVVFKVKDRPSNQVLIRKKQ